MKKINLDHWGVEDNKASISLSHLHAKFNILKNDDYIYFQLVVTDSKMDTLTFNFYTLEDVISFTEEVVNKCRTKEEVLSKYQQMYEEDLFRLPGGIKPPKKDKISLTPDEVDQAIIDYFGNDKNYRVSVNEELYIDYQGQPQISFYLTEHLDYDGIKKDIKYMLTNGDLKNALSSYIEFYDYELIDFKYIGGVHKVGMYIDEEKPYYEGIELNVKKNTNVKQSINQKKLTKKPKFKE